MKLLLLLTIVSVASASPPEFEEVVTNADVQLLQATLSIETKFEDKVKMATAKQASSLVQIKNATQTEKGNQSKNTAQASSLVLMEDATQMEKGNQSEKTTLDCGEAGRAGCPSDGGVGCGFICPTGYGVENHNSCCLPCDSEVSASPSLFDGSRRYECPAGYEHLYTDGRARRRGSKEPGCCAPCDSGVSTVGTPGTCPEGYRVSERPTPGCCLECPAGQIGYARSGYRWDPPSKCYAKCPSGVSWSSRRRYNAVPWTPGVHGGREQPEGEGCPTGYIPTGPTEGCCEPLLWAPAPACDACEEDRVYTDSDGTSYQIYKVSALSGSFGNDRSKAWTACGQRANGKPLAMYTDLNSASAAYNDCNGQTYKLKDGSNLDGNANGDGQLHANGDGQLQDVWNQDAMVGNYNTCNHPNGKKYIYQGVWSNNVPSGAKLICAVPLVAKAYVTNNAPGQDDCPGGYTLVTNETECSNSVSSAFGYVQADHYYVGNKEYPTFSHGKICVGGPDGCYLRPFKNGRDTWLYFSRCDTNEALQNKYAPVCKQVATR